MIFNRPFRTGFAIACFIGMACAAHAEGWHKVGSFTAGGGPKDAVVKRRCEELLIRPTTGPVDIKSVTIQSKTGKQTLTGRTFEKGNKDAMPIGSEQSVDSIQITDSGEAKYDVYVK